MSLRKFMRQVAGVFTLQSAVDSSGGVYQTWVQQDQVPCLVRPVSGGVDRELSKDGSAATHVIYLLGSWPLDASHQIHVGANIYNVIRAKDINSLGHHTEIECLLETS